jgi:hypothetical protein
MIIILKVNREAYSGKFEGFPTAPRCAICRSDVVCLLTGITYAVRQSKLYDFYF